MYSECGGSRSQHCFVWRCNAILVVQARLVACLDRVPTNLNGCMQVLDFLMYLGGGTFNFGTNARPPQPLNSRTVEFNL